MMWREFRRQLRERSTLLTALVVGMVINLYGQVMVPLLRGSDDAARAFGREVRDAPLLALVSVGLGFTFPWLVSAYASARARVEISAAASLARFPDLKPDPVFRANLHGRVVEAGAQTRLMFERHDIVQAQDILGVDLWTRVADTVARHGRLSGPETAYFAPADQWYVVTASAAPDGINVYLSIVPDSGPERHDGRPNRRNE